jgi:hypothetical protein
MSGRSALPRCHRPSIPLLGRSDHPGHATWNYSEQMVAMLIARFDGDVDELSAAYDRAHELIMSRGVLFPAVN